MRAVLLILSGNAAASLLMLVRNLLIARLIPVEDYGIAATFAIVAAVVEMTSSLGLQQQIVQARRGDDPDFQAALQGFQLLRGAIAALALLLLAETAADFLNVPEAAWAYRVMAAIPLLNAMQHFDIHRLNRQMVFLPAVLTNAVPALASVLLVWPLAALFGDYRVMLYALLAHAVLMVAFSHLTARRPWRLSLNREVMAGALRYGWPLLINNLILFAVFNGDRVIVGREIGMATLAVFSMGLTLTLTPTLVLAKSTQNFFLPQLSRAWGADPGGARAAFLSRVAIEVPLLAGALLVVATVLAGRPVVYLLLGEKYLDLLPVLAWFALMQALRMAKVGLSITALATAYTANMLVANVVRISVLPVAWYVATHSGDLRVIILVGCAGEIGGYVTALVLLRRKIGLRLRPLAVPNAAWALTLAAAAALSLRLDAAAPAVAPLWAWVGLCALFLACLAGMHDLRRYALRRS